MDEDLKLSPAEEGMNKFKNIKIKVHCALESAV